MATVGLIRAAAGSGKTATSHATTWWLVIPIGAITAAADPLADDQTPAASGSAAPTEWMTDAEPDVQVMHVPTVPGDRSRRIPESGGKLRFAPDEDRAQGDISP